MTKEDKTDGTYVESIRRSTNSYVEGLLQEVERGRKLIATLDQRVASLDEENLRLQDQLSELGEELNRRSGEQRRLQEELLGIEAQNRQFYDEFLVVEQQNANLANLYVASYRLHAAMSKGDVVSAILEIVINMVGSEQVGVYESRGGFLELIGGLGVDEGTYTRVNIGEGELGRAAAAGTIYIAKDDGKSQPSTEDGSLQAFVPLNIEEESIGAIAVFGLLEQKSALEAFDAELFELLKTHASKALYSANLHERYVSRER